jgi:hypothetical protein
VTDFVAEPPTDVAEQVNVTPSVSVVTELAVHPVCERHAGLRVTNYPAQVHVAAIPAGLARRADDDRFDRGGRGVEQAGDAEYEVFVRVGDVQAALRIELQVRGVHVCHALGRLEATGWCLNGFHDGR